ncbi:hypothetical protein AB0J71_46390 [Nonomuraea sp. NPDC049637]|uniref:hypothetical protein n=1 Tax=Nonomuraea sp. NPDC049637 TaxID=3154356 RepID=UPI00341980BD
MPSPTEALITQTPDPEVTLPQVAPPSVPEPAPSPTPPPVQTMRLADTATTRPGIGWQHLLLAIPAIVLIVAVVSGLVLVEARTRITRPSRTRRGELHIGQHRAL